MRATWSNWSGSVTASPAAIRYPASLNAIIAIVRECRECGCGLRVAGAGHSFTPLAWADGVLVSLDRYTGLERVDLVAAQATVRAGTQIKALGELLFAHGLAQANLGDIDMQSIAGAISTGTHGSGATLGSISTQVVGLTLVTASGELLECSETRNRDIFKAAQVSLGALGIITSVTLQLLPAYRLDYTWRRQTLDECLSNVEDYRRDNRNFEFFWLPYSNGALTKRMNVTLAPARSKNVLRQLNELALENGVFWAFSELCRRFPAASPQVGALLGRLISGGRDVNYSHKIFATPRLVKFQEMEYSLPAENLVVALRAIDACIRRNRFLVHFPIECRFVHADDIYLSPACQRDSAYIAVHMYKGMAYQAYFDAAEAIMRAYGGRPHWGKMHSLTAHELRPLYPRWDDFQAVRRRLDPEGLFLNAYLRTLLGEAANDQRD
jgi:FAD-linked oxidoreductase